MTIILSTRNPTKAVQIQAIFADSPISILTLADAHIEGEGIEDGTTLEANAFKKALFAQEKSGLWGMADDTGLFINALQGKPGVYAARWAGETATTDEITLYTLKQLEGVTDRSAIFETVVAVVSPEGKEYFFSGKVHGKLLKAPRTKPQPHMPYSPLFVPDGSDKVWAEMTVEVENSLSHRGIAFRQARDFLIQL